MSFLKSITSAVTPASGAPRQNNAFGLVVQLISSKLVKLKQKDTQGNEIEVDGVQLLGKALNGNSHVAEGETVSIGFRGKQETPIANLRKGQGKTVLNTDEGVANSTVTLESCYVASTGEDGVKVLSSRWLNTLTVAGDADHANRSFTDNIYATAPRITFKNPDRQPGEPANITLPVNADTVSLKVTDGGATGMREFPRDWAVQKLAKAGEKDRLTVTIDQVSPADAVKADGRDALVKALSAQLGTGSRALALLRISDGSEVRTRLVYVSMDKEFKPDVEGTIKDLESKNIFKGVPNEKLYEGLAAGALVLESIPGYRMTYAGNPFKDDNAAFKLVNDVKKGNAGRYEVIFGKDPQSFAKVILPGIARTEEISGFSPINVITDEPGRFTAAELPTAHIAPKVELDAEAHDDVDEDEAVHEEVAEAEESSAPRP